MHERHEELTALDTRINATKAAPETIAFEVRRMEEEAKKLIADLRTAAAMEPSKARALVARIFDGKLTATPVETEDGPRFLIEGVASMARMLAIEGEGGQQKPPDKYVSPAGVEYGDGDPNKPSTHAILAEKSRELFGMLLPSRPIRFPRVPWLGAGSRQPDGNDKR